MSVHYYTNNQDIESNPSDIQYVFKGVQFSFQTDLGVFSKEFIDYGTKVLIENITINDQKSLLDVGCGYGVIGITLQKVYELDDVHMVDVNLRAIHLTKENTKRNNVSNFNIYESDVYTQVNSMFDLIVSNPPIRAGKRIINRIIDESVGKLNPGGELWMVAKKKHGAQSMIKRLQDLYGNCEIIKRDKGYYVFKSTFMR